MMQIETARKKARAADCSRISDLLATFRNWSGPVDNKSLRGFNHEQMGRLICDPHDDWDDVSYAARRLLNPAFSSFSIREGYRSGHRQTDPRRFPRFLYCNDRISSERIYEGFLKNELLIKVFHIRAALAYTLTVVVTFQTAKAVFWGPCSIHDRKRAASRNRHSTAALHEMTTITPGAIAYCAMLVSSGCHDLIDPPRLIP